MTVAVTTGWDATHKNLPHAPASGEGAGYTTGTPDIVWDAADWKRHPGSVRIDQDAAASDHTADVLDVETGAATPAECPGWVDQARAAFKAGTRAGQREPMIYVNGSNVTPVANALAKAGITNVPLWLADPGISLAGATAKITGASGPYPIAGVQYAWDQFYDQDVWSTSWLTTISGGSPPPATAYRNVVPEGNTESLYHVAVSRHVPESFLVSLSLANLGPANTVVLNDYLALEQACLAAGLLHPAMPAGMVYYTKHQP